VEYTTFKVKWGLVFGQCRGTIQQTPLPSVRSYKQGLEKVLRRYRTPALPQLATLALVIYNVLLPPVFFIE
jgi:hypothetical protein